MNDKDDPVWQISKALAVSEDADLIHDFLSSILTEYELDEVSKRWALVQLIDDGMSQRNISKELGLSLCKITRGSKELKKPDSPFKKMINVYKNQVSEQL
jgi:TrpR family transcriptional regulator, trp operon repressor